MSYPTIKQISLDIYNSTIVYFNAKQGDTGSRYVEITCTENGKRIIIDGESSRAYIKFKKPDGTYGLNDAEIMSDGKIKVELTQQMLAMSGRAQFDIILVDAIGEIIFDENSGYVKVTDISLVSTICFYVNVLSSTVDDTLIESSNEFTAFTNAIARNITLEKELQENEAERQTEEIKRQANEKTRNSNENSRKSAETARKNAENDRVTEENTRKSAESKRVFEETKRVNAENERITNETSRQNAETSRKNAESTRNSAENERKIAESARVDAENERQSAEANRKSVEANRKSSETSRVEAENERRSAEVNRKSAETSRVEAEAARVIAESDRVDAESARETNVNNIMYNATQALTDANTAVERANTAAEKCENIAAGTGIVFTTDIVNNLTTTETGKVLDATQGTELLSMITSLQQTIANMPKVHTGTTDPSNTLGNNGDYYLKLLTE